jgi:hypothetical protein
MHEPGIAVRRRTLLAAGGAGVAATALAACGTEAEDPSAERDVELLGAAVAAERALSRTYGFAIDSAGGSLARALTRFSRASEQRLGELTAMLERQGGSAQEAGAAAPAQAESAIEAAKLELEQALSAYREAAALLSVEEQRRTVLSFMADDAAELAVVGDVLGDREAPDPFVTGGDGRPLVTSEPVEEDE